MSFEACQYCGKSQRELARGNCCHCDTREAAIRQRLRDNTLMFPDTDDFQEHESTSFGGPPLPVRGACDGCGEVIAPGDAVAAFTGWDGRAFHLHESCWKILLRMPDA
jgi:hypothetical protein